MHRRFSDLGVPVLAFHLLLFCVVAWIAFERNFHALFFHFDGSYSIVDAFGQRGSRHGALELSSHFGQSIGTIQFLSNNKLFFFFWPFDLISDLRTAEVVVYILTGIATFLAVFSMTRLLGLPRAAGLLAGWLISVPASPFVALPFFYAIYWSAPQYVLVVIAPPMVFALMKGIGRVSWAVDGLCTVGLLAVGLYLLATSPTLSAVIAPGLIPYVAIALCISRERPEFLRKLLAIAVIGVVAVALRWPWYVYGLFSYTAAYFFPSDFISVYRHPLYVSLLFQGPYVGWVGPTIVGAAALGAILSWRAPVRELRIAARVIVVVIVCLATLGVLFTLFTNWILPPPLYPEVAMWSLYGTFAAAAVWQVARRIRWPSATGWQMASAGQLLLAPVAAAAGLGFAVAKPPMPSLYIFPQVRTSMVDILTERMAIADGRQFSGRVATILPISHETNDAWMQQFNQAVEEMNATGNDHFSLGLWWYRIPTLFEYSPFSAPGMHALKKRALQALDVTQQRNVAVYSRANERILQLLGVRYVISRNATDGKWGMYELPNPNLATYSPTVVEHRSTIGEALDLVASADFDPERAVVVSQPIVGRLVPIEKSTLTFIGEDLHLRASSAGRSLIVVPLAYSHCLEVQDARTKDAAGYLRLQRVDGILTGILFERDVDVVLSFRIGPLHNAMCRFEDYRDFKVQDGAGR